MRKKGLTILALVAIISSLAIAIPALAADPEESEGEVEPLWTQEKWSNVWQDDDIPHYVVQGQSSVTYGTYGGFKWFSHGFGYTQCKGGIHYLEVATTLYRDGQWWGSDGDAGYEIPLVSGTVNANYHYTSHQEWHEWKERSHHWANDGEGHYDDGWTEVIIDY